MTVRLQARVPDEVAAAVRERAREQGKSLAVYVTELMRRDLRAARRERFWAEVERTMTTPEAVADLQADAERYAGSLMPRRGRRSSSW